MIVIYFKNYQKKRSSSYLMFVHDQKLVTLLKSQILMYFNKKKRLALAFEHFESKNVEQGTL